MFTSHCCQLSNFLLFVFPVLSYTPRPQQTAEIQPDRSPRCPTAIPVGCTTSRPDEFLYQAELPAAGWELLAEPQVTDTTIELLYHKGEQTLGVSIETAGAGARVALWPGEE